MWIGRLFVISLVGVIALSLAGWIGGRIACRQEISFSLEPPATPVETDSAADLVQNCRPLDVRSIADRYKGFLLYKDLPPSEKVTSAHNMLNADSIVTAFDFLETPDNGVGFEWEEKFIRSLESNHDILWGLSRSTSSFAGQLGVLLTSVNLGQTVRLKQLINLVRQQGCYYHLRLFRSLYYQMRQNYLTGKVSRALSELHQDPDAANVFEQVIGPLPEPGPARAFTESRADTQATQRVGRRFALLIGIQTYQSPEIPRLETAAADVEAVGRSLERLGYQTEIMTDPAKKDIVAAMARLGRDLVPEDELILYYAGHNILLKEPRLGFWLPADAGISTARRWLSNRDVSQFLASVKARQVVLIVDGSFAGSSVPSYEPRLIDRALVEQYLPSRRAVMVFNSGGEEPVASEEMDGHSLLAYHLMRKLDRLPAEGAAGFDLFADLSGSIIQKVLQTPAYFPIIMAGHDDGMDFLFRRSLRRPAQTETVIPMGADARLDDLMWDAVAGKPEPFYRLLDLAQGGDHAAQSAVGRAFKYRNWSRHDKIRSLAWASVAAQRANDAKEVAEANQIGNQDLAVRADVNAFLDGLFRRHPDLRSPPMRPAPEGQP